MCKEIAPEDGGWGEYKGKYYNKEYPKTVKLNVPLLSGWIVINSFEHMEPFFEMKLNRENGEQVKVPVIEISSDGVERLRVHTCKRVLQSPDNKRYEGHRFYTTLVRRNGPWDRTEEFISKNK